MNRWAIVTLRVVIAIALAGSLVAQLGLVALLWWDTDADPTATGISLVAIGVLGVGTLQVIAVCIWRLLTMVRRGTVFSPAAFRYVNVVIGALIGAALLVFSVAVVARFANRATAGDAVAPGLVGLICGFAVVCAGVALVVYVMRNLLAQAVALDTGTKRLQAELDGVI